MSVVTVVGFLTCPCDRRTVFHASSTPDTPIVRHTLPIYQQLVFEIAVIEAPVAREDLITFINMPGLCCIV